jgi:hypothetical protein
MIRKVFRVIWYKRFLTVSFCFYHSKTGVLSQTRALEVSISYCRTLNFIGCTRGAPNGCSPRASSGFLKIIYSKVFTSSIIRNHFFSLALCWRSALFFILPYALEVGIVLTGAPNGCSPRASSGFLKIIHSKVFISCPFVENHPLFFRMP